MFVLDRDGDYRPIGGEDPQLTPTLPAGVYTIGFLPTGGGFFRPISTSGDQLVSLDTPTGRKVAREIQDFFNPEITARLASAGVKHRRGIILHGQPGTGKTSLVRAFLPQIVALGAVVLSEINPALLQEQIIPAIRKHDPARPIVLVWDEFDKSAEHAHSELLRLLDGMSSPDHLLTIGVTNNLRNIPETLRCRPSRFGLILKVPPLGQEARTSYARTKYPMLDDDTIANVVQITEGKALDYIEEGCKLALMGYDADEIRDRVQIELKIVTAEQIQDEY